MNTMSKRGFMTKEELAEKLHGREYPFNLTKDEIAEAKTAGLVIIYGASDDLLEFEGAIYDEVGAHDGGEAFIANGKLLSSQSDLEEDEDVLKKYGVLEHVKA